MQALDGADFDVDAGEVVALIGDNGAGKSTLVKALTGNLDVDEGEVRFDGSPVHFTTPQDASRLGIEVVHQDLALAPHLDAAQNMFLGREVMRPGLLGHLGFMDTPAMRQRSAKAFTELGSAVRSVVAPVGSMSGGQKQSVAIARAVAWADKVLFLDEPTAALGVIQTRNVLDTIKRVRDKGHRRRPHLALDAPRPGGRRPRPGPATRQAGRHLPRRGHQRRGARRRHDRCARHEGGSGMSTQTERPRGDLDDRDRAPRTTTSPSASRSMQSVWILGVLVVIVAVFGVLAPDTFLTPGNLTNIAQNVSIWAVLAVGMTFVIITSGIDLSVGSVLVVSSVVAAKVMESMGDRGWGTAVGRARCSPCVVGVFWGSLNGFLVAKAKVPPLIVTLGTLSVALGVAQILTGGLDIRSAPAVLQDNIGYGRRRGHPGDLDHRARHRHHRRDPAAPHPVRPVHVRHRLERDLGPPGRHQRRPPSSSRSTRCPASSPASPGILSLAQYGTTTIAGQSLTNLNVIAAVVIGGTSIFGGQGSMFGSMVGLFIPAVLQSGFVIIGVSPYWQTVAVGSILITAVYVDQHRRAAAVRGRG